MNKEVRPAKSMTYRPGDVVECPKREADIAFEAWFAARQGGTTFEVTRAAFMAGYRQAIKEYEAQAD